MSIAHLHPGAHWPCLLSCCWNGLPCSQTRSKSPVLKPESHPQIVCRRTWLHLPKHCISTHICVWPFSTGPFHQQADMSPIVTQNPKQPLWAPSHPGHHSISLLTLTAQLKSIVSSCWHQPPLPLSLVPHHSPESALVTSGLDQTKGQLSVLTFPGCHCQWRVAAPSLRSPPSTPISPPHPNLPPVHLSISICSQRDPFKCSFGSHSSAAQLQTRAHVLTVADGAIPAPCHLSALTRSSLSWACLCLPSSAVCFSAPPHEASPSIMPNAPSPGPPPPPTPLSCSRPLHSSLLSALLHVCSFPASPQEWQLQGDECVCWGCPLYPGPRTVQCLC